MKLSFKQAVKNNKNLKYGGYMTLIVVCAIAAFVLVNILFEQLKVTIDLTEQKMYSIGSKTKVILEDLEDDITVYGLYVTGNENTDVIALVQDYLQNSDKITYKQVNPYTNPEFTEPYKDDSDTIATMSLIVENNRTGKFKIIDNSDLYEYDTEIDESTYSTKTVLSAFAAEEQLTSAIQYVTNENTPIIYMMSGHGESDMYSALGSALTKANYDIEGLNLITGDTVAATEYTIIWVNNPIMDLSEYEYEDLYQYMEDGGRMIINLSAKYPVDSMTNWNRLLEHFGIKAVSGTVIETNSNYYYRYPTLIIPEVADHEITSEQSGTIASLMSLGLQIMEERDHEIEISGLLSTSDDAIAKWDTYSTTYDFEEGDTKGPFYIGIVSERSANDEGSATYPRLVVYGSSYMFDNDSGYMTNGNYSLIVGTLNYLQTAYDTLYIDPKDFIDEQMDVTTGQFVASGIVYIAVIPIALIIAGLFVWGRRKRL